MTSQPPTNTVILSDDIQAALAMELAVQLLDTPQILERFSLKPAQLKKFIKDDNFRRMVGQFRADWEAAENVTARVRLKAGAALEDSLAQLYIIAHDTDMQPQARIDAIKQLASLADAVPRKDVSDTGSKFSVVINLPSGEPVKIEAPVTMIEGDFKDE